MNLLTQHLDTWTTAPNGIKKLRELILELAVRGLLVPQNSDDEPASVLLEKIADEKAQLCAEGKIKKSAPLPKIADDEKPFDLPTNWIWARLNDCYDVRDGTHDSPKAQSTGYPLITSKNLYSGKLDFTHVTFISEQDHLKIIERSRVNRNDVLFAMIGTIGNPVIVDTDVEFSIKNVALFKRFSDDFSVPNYLKMYLELASITIKEKSSGGVQSFVSLGALRAYLFPLPPLAEQHRIVAKVDELMQLCDQLEQKQTSNQEIHAQLVSTLLTTLTQATDPQAFQAAWTRIAANFDSLFTTESSIEQLKQTILQLAVMGKLVEQEAGDEPASVLLEKIAQEKARLISEGKIKKSAPLPKIADDEKPFDLPIGWEWVRTNDVCESIVDCPHSTPKYQNDGMDCIDTTCFDDRGILLKTRKVDEITFNERNARLIPKYEDIVYSREGIIGQAVIVPKNGKYCLGQRVMLFRPSLFVSAVLLRLLITSPFFKNSMTENHKGIGAKHINMSDLRADSIATNTRTTPHRCQSE
jgi:type I restriction enzyme S subunit